ncbi:MAG TPA: glycosyltransferase family 39 protein, partial [Candidatus Udaeobacter sp.]|nr:glycosyltransferase family 39 protein [Candidatus Udaeobacter sp.]
GLPLLIAASFRVFGVNDAAAVAPSAIAWVLCVGLAAWLARRLFGSVAGWITALLLALHPAALGLAVVALAEIPAALAITVSAGLLLLGRGRRTALAAGLVFGAGQVLRENLLLALPGMLLLAAHRRWFVGGCALVVAGLVARSLAIAGQPWVSLAPLSIQGFTSVYPAQDVLRHLDPLSLPEFLRAHPGAIAGKWLRNVAIGPVLLAMAVGLPLAAALLLPSLALMRGRIAPPGVTRLARALLWMFLLTIAGMAAFAIFPRYFVTWVPLVAVVAGGLGSAVWNARGASRFAVPAVVLPLGLMLGGYIWSVREPAAGNSYAKAQRFVADAVPANAVVASDFPEVALWQADRSAVWLPVTKDEFLVMRRQIEMPYVLLTSRRTPSGHPSWRAVWTRKDSLPGYMEAACTLDDTLELRLFKETGPSSGRLSADELRRSGP